MQWGLCLSRYADFVWSYPHRESIENYGIGTFSEAIQFIGSFREFSWWDLNIFAQICLTFLSHPQLKIGILQAIGHTF